MAFVNSQLTFWCRYVELCTVSFGAELLSELWRLRHSRFHFDVLQLTRDFTHSDVCSIALKPYCEKEVIDVCNCVHVK